MKGKIIVQHINLPSAIKVTSYFILIPVFMMLINITFIAVSIYKDNTEAVLQNVFILQLLSLVVLLCFCVTITVVLFYNILAKKYGGIVVNFEHIDESEFQD